jgi:hypothetical protein
MIASTGVSGQNTVCLDGESKVSEVSGNLSKVVIEGVWDLRKKLNHCSEEDLPAYKGKDGKINLQTTAITP